MIRNDRTHGMKRYSWWNKLAAPAVSMVSIMDGAPVALIDGVDCKEMTG